MVFSLNLVSTYERQTWMFRGLSYKDFQSILLSHWYFVSIHESARKEILCDQKPIGGALSANRDTLILITLRREEESEKCRLR